MADGSRRHQASRLAAHAPRLEQGPTQRATPVDVFPGECWQHVTQAAFPEGAGSSAAGGHICTKVCYAVCGDVLLGRHIDKCVGIGGVAVLADTIVSHTQAH